METIPSLAGKVAVVTGASRGVGAGIATLLGEQGATVYVTVEPCAMCAGALVQSRAARLVYGAEEPKGGAVRSCFAIFEHPAVNHRMEVINNILAADAAALLREFFASRR